MVIQPQPAERDDLYNRWAVNLIYIFLVGPEHLVSKIVASVIRLKGIII
jgi:hypothetical protein